MHLQNKEPINLILTTNANGKIFSFCRKITLLNVQISFIQSQMISRLCLVYDFYMAKAQGENHSKVYCEK